MTGKTTREPRGGMTAGQGEFLGDLLKDLRGLFDVTHRGKGERDAAAWMGGVLKKHVVGPESPFFTSWGEVEGYVAGLDRVRAGRLIKALSDLRTRLDGKLPRSAISTPGHLVSAIWKAAKGRGFEDETLREIVHDVTGGETSSTRQLRRGEALRVLDRIGRTPVFVMVRRRGGVELRKRGG